jgi:hypothetical protein
MDSAEPRDLDTTIDTALREDPLRPVPVGFCRRIRNRVALLTMIREERCWVRYSLAAGSGLFGALMITLAFFALFTDVPRFLVRDVPGGMGYYDYLVSAVFLSPLTVLATLALVLVLPFGATLITTIFGSHRPGGSH